MKSDDEMRDDIAAQMLPIYIQLHTRQVQKIAGGPAEIHQDKLGAAIDSYKMGEAMVLARRQVINNLKALEEKAERKNGARVLEG